MSSTYKVVPKMAKKKTLQSNTEREKPKKKASQEAQIISSFTFSLQNFQT